MAIFHTRIKVFGRSKNDSAIAKAAYRAAALLVDDEAGVQHDYRRKRGVLNTRCFAPIGAPEWATQPQALWRETHAKEKRKDSTLAREFEIALPAELSDEQRAELAWDICRDLTKRYGIAIQASIHAPPTADGLNYHLHALATTRRITADGLQEKTRELDGGPSGKAEVEWVREMVAFRINHHLAAAQIDARVDHRNLGEQLADALERGDLETAAELATREATLNMGPRATALHRRGADCAVADMNADIRRGNAQRHARLRRKLADAGVLPAAPNGHGHAQALQDRQREMDAALLLGNRSGSIQAVEGLGDAARVSAAERKRAKEQAVRASLVEAAQLWAEGFVAAIDFAFKATGKLLKHHAERAAAFAHLPAFRADVRAFLKCLQRLKNDALRFKRRLEAEDRSAHLVGHAQTELIRFDQEHPRPGLWTRREWQIRRARRLQTVAQRKQAHAVATAATGPEAQAEYLQRTRQTAAELERMSELMLRHYPMPIDIEPASAPNEETVARDGVRATSGPKM